jgi:hypothetical protein
MGLQSCCQFAEILEVNDSSMNAENRMEDKNLHIIFATLLHWLLALLGSRRLQSSDSQYHGPLYYIVSDQASQVVPPSSFSIFFYRFLIFSRFHLFPHVKNHLALMLLGNLTCQSDAPLPPSSSPFLTFPCHCCGQQRSPMFNFSLLFDLVIR